VPRVQGQVPSTRARGTILPYAGKEPRKDVPLCFCPYVACVPRFSTVHCWSDLGPKTVDGSYYAMAAASDTGKVAKQDLEQIRSALKTQSHVSGADTDLLKLMLYNRDILDDLNQTSTRLNTVLIVLTGVLIVIGLVQVGLAALLIVRH